MDFELDSQIEVNKLHKYDDVFELGHIIKECQHLYMCYFTNSCVEVFRRQVNDVAHVLRRVATSLTSFYSFTSVSTKLY